MSKRNKCNEKSYKGTIETMKIGRTIKLKTDMFFDDPQGTGIVFPKGTSSSDQQRLRDIKEWMYTGN
jgi:hypothetical protein